MPGPGLRCAYCGEFCADGIAPQLIATPEKQLPPPIKIQDR
jgi:hypothetical protein